jgi:hypothetical protein
MRAYSIDIREGVIENLDPESMRKTAKGFRVSEYFVYQLNNLVATLDTEQRRLNLGQRAPVPLQPQAVAVRSSEPRLASGV